MVWVNFIARARTATRNKRRAHARTCSYTGRPMATRANARDSESKRGESPVCTCVCVCTQDTRKRSGRPCGRHVKMLQRLHQLLRQRCGSSLFMSDKIFHASRWEGFRWITHARHCMPAKIVRLSKVRLQLKPAAAHLGAAGFCCA